VDLVSQMTDKWMSNKLAAVGCDVLWKKYDVTCTNGGSSLLT